MSEPPPLQQTDRTYVRFRGRKLSYFSGCDYFRLASHPKVLAAAKEGLRKFGSNVAASRLTTGNHTLYCQCEQALADFFKAPSALLVPTGYVANLVVAQALAGNFSHALIDAKAHPSLWDASQFLNSPVFQFKHRSSSDLANNIARCGPGAKLIVLTDGMFSFDGSVAPLAEYEGLLPKDGWILVDDAHGAGVLGNTGKGSLEHEGVSRRHIIQTATLSKAFGTYGGVVLCSTAIRNKIIERSQLFIGSTPIPLPLVNGALQSLRILKNGTRLRRQLQSNVAYVRKALSDSGVLVPHRPGPIISVSPKNSRQISAFNKQLRRAKILPPLLRYPTGPEEGYFRFVISSEHSHRQLDSLIGVLLPQNGNIFSPDENSPAEL